MADWSQTPPEILTLVSSRLPLLSDYLRFGAVCKPWGAARRATAQPPQLPWLLLHDQAFDSETPHRSFFSLDDRRSHDLLLPELAGRWCCGSSLGWLVTIDIDLQMHLLHPFIRHQIPLPQPPPTGMDHIYPPAKLRSISICKPILSADPVVDPSGCVVMAIHGIHGKLTYCRPGDEGWNLIDDEFGFYLDVVFYKGRFYGAATGADVVVCELGTVPKTVASATGIGSRGFPNYLVESNGDLFYVSRFQETSTMEDGDEHCKTVKVEVFKLDTDTMKWSEVRNLGDSVLFLTHNQALPLSEHGFPGCKNNFIYFANYHYNLNGTFAYDDVAMCNVGNGKIEPCDLNDAFAPFLFPSVYLNPILRPGGETRSSS